MSLTLIRSINLADKAISFVWIDRLMTLEMVKTTKINCILQMLKLIIMI